MVSGIIDPQSFAENISGLISAKKQVSFPYLDLTIGKLYRVKSSGQIDFGGSEFQSSHIEPCLPGKRNPEDTYGWWQLHEGYYILEYNENFRLSENQIAILQPHPHLLSTGCYHPTVTVTKIDQDTRIPIWIPKIGVQIKENARISRLPILDLSP